MDPAMVVLLTAVAVGTSIISAVIGMGGGITLLAVMFFADLPHFEIIALHGIVQLVSNAARTVAYRRSILRWISGAYLLGALPGTLLACGLIFLVSRLTAFWGEDPTESGWFKIGIALWIFSALVRTRGEREGYALGPRGFSLVALVLVPVSTLLGATGPILAPFFLRKDLVKEQVVGNKASCQILTHVFKLIAIGWMLRDTGPTGGMGAHAGAAISMCVAAVVGTSIGKWLMPRVSDALFRMLFKLTLGAAGIKILVVDGVLPLLGI